MTAEPITAAEIAELRRLHEAANADLHAVLELVAGNLRAAWEKRDDAPQSANAHLQEASFALVKFAPKDGTLSPNAAALRVLVREEIERLGEYERDAEAGKVNSDLLAAAKDLAVKAKAYVDQSWELERLRCDDAVAAFNAVVQRAEEAGRG